MTRPRATAPIPRLLSDLTPPTTTDSRLADLRRMKTLATGLLAMMAVVYLLAAKGTVTWPWLAYVRAFAEAAMVGACADWFAVTALFRRPFGLPIPHTAIIPRNKDRIGQSLGVFLAENFLTPDVLDERIRRLEVARWGGDWLRRPANARRLSRRLAALAPAALAALPTDFLRGVAGSAGTAALRNIPAAPLAGGALNAVWDPERAQGLADWAIERASAYLANHRDLVRSAVEGQSYRWMPRFVDKAIADKVTSGLLQALEDMRAPDHPWRMELASAVERLIEKLAHDADYLAKGEALKVRLMADTRLQDQATLIWTQIESGLTERLGEDLAPPIEKALLWMGGWLSDDDAAQARLNGWARRIARQVIAPNRHRIADAVANVVAAWDARSVVDKLELQVGRDLQFIRINGTIVGGLVGLALYALSRALGF